MMKNSKRKISIIATHMALLLSILAFQNCAKVSMTTEIPTVEAVENEASDSTNYICSPFSVPNKTSAKSGIRTNLKYISSSSTLTETEKSNLKAKEYFELNRSDILEVPAVLYLTNIHIPSRRFESGFSTTDGTQVKDNQGNLLVEYFALKMETILQLGPQDPEGYYEFATISDDGSVLQMKQNDQWVDVVSNDGPHSAQMGCLNGRVHLTKTSRIPIRYFYNQGARFEISNTLIWNYRGTDPANTNYNGISDATLRSYCGRASSEDFWNPMGSQEGPWIKEVWSQGWKPLSPENFLLPDDETNPCVN